MKPYLFIHINKTGGTSLWHLLEQSPQHQTAANLYEQIGPREWKQIKVFTLVRNPYDRAVSLYEYRKARNAQGILEKRMSFLEFLHRALKLKQSPYFNRAIMLGPQYDWLTDLEGNLIVPHIFSFENYRDSVGQILKLIGHPDPFGTPVPHIKGVPHKPWQTYYTGRSGEMAQEIVKKEWAKDFFYFNYPTEIRHE